jgi:hypothetical protein
VRGLRSNSRWLRGARRLPTATAPRLQGVEGPDLLDASLSLAQTQLLGQLADETSLDGRMMGTLAFNGALLAADIAARGVLGAYWWTPLIAVGLATAICLVPTLGIGPDFARDTDLGPGADTFYLTYGGQPSTAARKQLLADLGGAFANNARRLRAKQRALRAALVILAVGLIVAAVVIELNRPAKIGGVSEQAQHTQASAP